MIIDAKNVILGRLGTLAAKKALQGEEIMIVNADQAIVTGSWENILAKYKHKLHRGHPYKGPFVYRREDMFVKRSIRGMLPWDRERGKVAYKRIKCFIGVPEEMKEKKQEMIEVPTGKTKSLKYVTVKEICNAIGRKE